MADKFLIVVVGPTAVGKTALCVKLAQHYNIEIVSADSRQFYKEMFIGTAKPSEEEMDGVPHHLVDHISIFDKYTVADFEKEAISILEKNYNHSDLALLTGGSGLFIKAVCEGLDDMPSIKPGIRDQLIAEHQANGLKALLQELKEADPIYYEQVDRNNYVRVIRGLEIIRSTGKPFSSFRSGKSIKRPFQTIKIGLNRDREELYERINLRMDQMLASGLIDEAKALYPNKDLSALKTVGYQEIFDFWDGKHNWETAVQLLKQNSRRYAKRQLTWFRKDKELAWFHPNQEKEIIAHINQYLRKS